MRRAVLAIAGFVVAGLLSGIGPYADLRARMAPRGPFEESPAESPEEMIAALDRIDSNGRAAYVRQLWWDLIVIAGNGAWLWIWLRAAGRRAITRRSAAASVTMLAWLVVVADLLENIGLWLAFAAYPSITPGQVTFAGVATRAKFVCFGVAVLMAIVLSLTAGASRLKVRRPQ